MGNVKVANGGIFYKENQNHTINAQRELEMLRQWTFLSP